jgi:hypothetical protein
LSLCNTPSCTYDRKGFIFETSATHHPELLSDSKRRDIDDLYSDARIIHHPEPDSKFFNFTVEVVIQPAIAVRLRRLERMPCQTEVHRAKTLLRIDYTDYFEKIARMFFESPLPAKATSGRESC